jgi:hypothetical protein
LPGLARELCLAAFWHVRRWLGSDWFSPFPWSILSGCGAIVVPCMVWCYWLPSGRAGVHHLVTDAAHESSCLLLSLHGLVLWRLPCLPLSALLHRACGVGVVFGFWYCVFFGCCSGLLPCFARQCYDCVVCSLSVPFAVWGPALWRAGGVFSLPLLVDVQGGALLYLKGAYDVGHFNA